MKHLSIILILLLPISVFCQLSFSAPKDNPVELGKVKWIRNYDQAIKASKQTDKPIFTLFQEVPGCATCRNFGNDVLSHPFIVEMIETYFIPLAIFNNVNGHDREIIKKYNEPTWNNPVIRILNSNGKDIVERNGRGWSEHAVANSIKNALDISNIEIPEYFKLYRTELIGRSGEVKEANLAMYCFWTGEKELAKIDGILSTEPGYMNGHEVVKIEYNPYETNLKKIVPIARKAQCADEVYVDEELNLNVPIKRTSDYRKDKDNKYYLSKTDYKYIPMTDLQAAKVNSAIGSGLSPNNLLSPRQLELFTSLKGKKGENQIGKDFSKAWNEIINN